MFTLIYLLLSLELELKKSHVVNLDLLANPADIYGMVMDDSGQIYSTILLEPLIQAFGVDGKSLRPIGKAGRGPGEFQYPMPLAYDDGFLYTIDNGRGMLYKIDPISGSVKREWRIATSNAIHVYKNKALVAFNSPSDSHMFSLYSLGSALELLESIYSEETCRLAVKGSKHGGGVIRQDGSIWASYSGDYRLLQIADGHIKKDIRRSPEGFKIPSPSKASRFNRNAAKTHYRSFDKIRRVLSCEDYIILYRYKTYEEGVLDIYSTSGIEIVLSMKIGKTVPFQTQGNDLYAFTSDKDDNVSLIKLSLVEAPNEKR